MDKIKDPRITPEMVENGRSVFNTLIKAVKSLVTMMTRTDFKVILVLVDDSRDEPEFAICSEVEDTKELASYLHAAIGKIEADTFNEIRSGEVH